MTRKRTTTRRLTCFLREFCRHPKELGTIAQSSRTLARKIARQIDGSTKVVELGPGAGAVTVEILKRLPYNGQLTCVEINTSFCEYLTGLNDPRLKIVNDDARNCERHLNGSQCVVSGLPIALFPKADRTDFLDKVSRVNRFIQLQYTPLLSKRLRSYFTHVKVKFVMQNLPPAFICVCSQRSSDVDQDSQRELTT